MVSVANAPHVQYDDSHHKLNLDSCINMASMTGEMFSSYIIKLVIFLAMLGHIYIYKLGYAQMSCNRLKGKWCWELPTFSLPLNLFHHHVMPTNQPLETWLIFIIKSMQQIHFCHLTPMCIQLWETMPIYFAMKHNSGPEESWFIRINVERRPTVLTMPHITCRRKASFRITLTDYAGDELLLRTTIIRYSYPADCPYWYFNSDWVGCWAVGAHILPYTDLVQNKSDSPFKIVGPVWMPGSLVAPYITLVHEGISVVIWHTLLYVMLVYML